MIFVPAEDTRRDEGWAELRRELDRCRRYGRSFGLVMIAGAASANGNGGGAAAPELVSAVRALVRRMDFVWEDAGNVYALLPEADAGACTGLTARIAADAVVGSCVSRYVVFPDDGVTSGALLRALGPAERADEHSDERTRRTKGLTRARLRWRAASGSSVVAESAVD